MNSPDMDPDQTIFLTRPHGLARFLSLEEEASDLWEPKEMEAMWQHQLAAPLDLDLDTLGGGTLRDLKDPAELDFLHGKTFGELFADAQPPLGLLKLVKEFAKQMLKDSADAQVKQLASVLYYVSYAAAWIRWQTPIGTMNEAELASGLSWAAERAWLDAGTRQLISAARDTFDKKKAR
jgi:hypothetical protein